ncbi:MAG: hypothetical protein ACI3XR_07985 [Eubacteriales bacterium]
MAYGALRAPNRHNHDEEEHFDTMKSFNKTLFPILTAFLLTLSVLLSGCEFGFQKEESVGYDAYQKKISSLQAQIDELQAQIDEPMAELTPGAIAVVGLGGAYASVYTYVYPLLQKAGIPAVVVLEDGRMPGEDGMMTMDQAKELISAGWEFALGDSSEIQLLKDTGMEPTAEWLTYLDDSLAVMQNLGLPTPTTFCFGQNRYHPAAEQALADRGFKVIRHCFSDETTEALKVREELYSVYGIEMYGRNLSDSGLIYRIGGAIVRADASTAQLNVETAIRQRAAVSIAVGRVLPTVEDRNSDCTLEKFTLMVNNLLEYQKSYDLQILTFTGMYDYKAAFEEDLDNRTAEYEAQSAALQAEIDKIKGQIEKLMQEMMEESGR